MCHIYFITLLSNFHQIALQYTTHATHARMRNAARTRTHGAPKRTRGMVEMSGGWMVVVCDDVVLWGEEGVNVTVTPPACCM